MFFFLRNGRLDGVDGMTREIYFKIFTICNEHPVPFHTCDLFKLLCQSYMTVTSLIDQ